MKRVNRIPPVVRCVICERKLHTDTFLGKLLFFWLPSICYVEMVLMNAQKAIMLSVCRMCFELVDKDPQQFVILVSARFTPRTHGKTQDPDVGLRD